MATDAATGPTGRTAFGQPMKAHFQFKDGYRNLNQGSFGATPKAVTEQLRRFQDECEARPDVFMRYAYSNYLLEARRAAAQVLHAPLKNVVLVQNATTGINVVLRNLQYAPTDHIVVFSTIYPGCEMTVQSLAETTGARVTTIPLVFPNVTHASIVAAFGQALAQIRAAGGTPRVAVFDTVVATPAARLPFEELTRVCKAEGVLSCIDAAHGAGLLPLDLGALDPDFLTTNLHKWLFVPRGCAALYVAERSQHLLRTALPTSWGFVPAGRTLATYLAGPRGYQQSAFEALFETVGTFDMSGFFSVPAAVQWRETVCGGEAAIIDYLVTLGAAGAQRMADELGTEVLDNAAGELTRGLGMRTVRLPLDVAAVGAANTAKALAFVSARMLAADVYAPPLEHGGRLWVRICAQVYLDEDDFGVLAAVLREACQQVASGAYLE